MIRRGTHMRLLTVSVLLTIYGALAVIGYGLHDLLHIHHHGDHHSHQIIDFDHGGAGHVCCAGHGHSHDGISEEVCATTSKTTASKTTPDGKAAQAVEGECALCLLLTQAQEPSLRFSAESLVAINPAQRSAEELLHPLYVPDLYLARGPPLC